MIQMKKNGAELSTALAEIQRLRDSEEVRTAQMMQKVTEIVDLELRTYRKLEREGRSLIDQGINTDELREILKLFGGGIDDA